MATKIVTLEIEIRLIGSKVRTRTCLDKESFTEDMDKDTFEVDFNSQTQPLVDEAIGWFKKLVQNNFASLVKVTTNEVLRISDQSTWPVTYLVECQIDCPRNFAIGHIYF